MSSILEQIKVKFQELLIVGVFSVAVYFIKTIYTSVSNNTKSIILVDKNLERLNSSSSISLETSKEILRQLKEHSNEINQLKIDTEVLKSKHN